MCFNKYVVRAQPVDICDLYNFITNCICKRVFIVVWETVAWRSGVKRKELDGFRMKQN